MALPVDSNQNTNNFDKFLNPKDTKSKLIFLAAIFGIATFIAVVYTAPFQKKDLSQRYAKPEPQAAVNDLATLTDQLRQKGQPPSTSRRRGLQIQSDSERERGETVSMAKRRKDLLIQEIKNNPQRAKQYLIPENVRTQFPPSVQDYIEKEKEITGKVTSGFEENFEKGVFKHNYGLTEQGSNQSYSLYFVNPPTNLQTGSQVKIRGVATDRHLLTEAPTDLGVLTEPSLGVQGQKRVAVILIRTNNISPGFTKEQVAQFMYDQNGRVNSFYQSNSQGRVSFRGDINDIFGWHILPAQSPVFGLACAIPGLLGEEGQQALREVGIDTQALARYDGFIVVSAADPNQTTSNSGCGTLGGRPFYSYIGGAQNMVLERVQFTFIHELGHNLGLHHANFLNCPYFVD